MPISVSELFASVGLAVEGPVKWYRPLPATSGRDKGVYVVALSSYAEDKTECLLEQAPVNLDVVNTWVEDVPSLTLDGTRLPTLDLTERVANRISRYWLPDEPILYIGMTNAKVRNRVRDYYCTELGEARPHRGGHWLKTLSVLDDLYVYWAITPELDPEAVEDDMLTAFAASAPAWPAKGLYTEGGPFPFANLEHKHFDPKWGFRTAMRKNHGIGKPTND